MANAETYAELTTRLVAKRQSLNAPRKKVALLEDRNEELKLAREAIGAQGELLNSTGCPILGKDSRIQGLYSAHLHGNLHGRFATYKTHRIHELKFTHAQNTYSR